MSAWAFVNGKWLVYDPNTPGFSDLTSMGAGKGYWLNMIEPRTLSVLGFAPSTTMALGQGWNLVGYNHSEALLMDAALASIHDQCRSVWAFINGSWQVYDALNPGFSDLTDLSPDYGYWIQVTDACTWTLP